MDGPTAILFVVGLVLLIAGGELLVGGASRLAGSFGVSPVLIGLTVVAFGTSSPELAVSIGSSLAGEPDLVIGNVVGSNIYNILLVLGLAALIGPLVVQAELVRRDVPLMVLASGGTAVLALDGSIGRLDGVVLLGGLVAWLAFSVWQSRKMPAPAMPPTAAGGRLRSLGSLIAGLVLLVIGARWLVDGAVAVATGFGLSPLVVGLTVVAIGTSLPEIATSVIASARGQRDIAVGNVVGSNLFNILAVLGITALIADIPVAPGAVSFDIPIMFAVALACLPIFFTGHRIARWEGGLFLVYGIAYTVYLVANATEHDELTSFTEAAATVVIPLTALTLIVIAWRELRSLRRSRLLD